MVSKTIQNIDGVRHALGELPRFLHQFRKVGGTRESSAKRWSLPTVLVNERIHGSGLVTREREFPFVAVMPAFWPDGPTAIGVRGREDVVPDQSGR